MSTKSELERARAAIDFLCERFPSAFSLRRGGIRPLKPEILDDIVSELGAEEFRAPMKMALAYYRTREHYLRKTISGKWYRDLHGNRINLIPEEDKNSAERKLQIIQSKKRPRAQED